MTHRLTKIICTLGPSCRTEEEVTAMVQGGMNVARFNFSHGSYEEHGAALTMLKKICKKLGKNVATLIDVKGCEIRTVDVEKPLQIAEGEEVVFSPLPHPKTKGKVIQVDHQGFVHDAKGTKIIFVDNGEMIFDVLEVNGEGVRARAQTAGVMGSRRHVNLPGAAISLPSITEKDWQDITWACENDIDFVGVSFVRTAKDMEDVHAFLQKKGKKMGVISKIENTEAVTNIAEIIEASDVVMVARGDLGAEIPYEKVPAVQDNIVASCRKVGKPVIVSTHMLESMVKVPLPTRAEVSDIAHACMTGTDCTMLTGETANGKFPARCLQVMDRVLLETEHGKQGGTMCFPREAENPPEPHAVSALAMAEEMKAAGILVFNVSLATTISQLRPTMPIFTVMHDEKEERLLQVYFAVESLHVDTDDVQSAMSELKKQKLVQKGDHLVVITPTNEVESVSV